VRWLRLLLAIYPPDTQIAYFRLAGGGTSSVVININALGVRDPSICASCNSIYTDSYTVNLFNQTGALLESVNKTSYLYYNMFTAHMALAPDTCRFQFRQAQRRSKS
jgi:hypothetical protein